MKIEERDEIVYVGGRTVVSGVLQPPMISCFTNDNSL